MEIYYTEETLYINLTKLDENAVKTMTKRVFRILNDYDIENVTVNILDNENYQDNLFNEFIFEYNLRFNGKLTIKGNA